MVLFIGIPFTNIRIKNKGESMFNLSPEELAELVEFGEIEGWTNMYQFAPSEFVKKYRLEAKQLGSAWVYMIPELDMRLFNRIVGLGIREYATETQLDDAIDILQKAGCKNFMIPVSPMAQPDQVTDWLEARGFINMYSWVKMCRGDEPASSSSTDLKIISIGNEHADAFADVALTAFKMPSDFRSFIRGLVGKPGWRHYLGYDGEQPVSAAAMFVKDENGHLGWAGTLDSHRKRGGQGAMFEHRIKDGLALGCKWFVTETWQETSEDPNPSYHNMLRAGFKLAYVRPNYVFQPPSS